MLLACGRSDARTTAARKHERTHIQHRHTRSTHRFAAPSLILHCRALSAISKAVDFCLFGSRENCAEKGRRERGIKECRFNHSKMLKCSNDNNPLQLGERGRGRGRGRGGEGRWGGREGGETRERLFPLLRLGGVPLLAYRAGYRAQRLCASPPLPSMQGTAFSPFRLPLCFT